MRISKIYCSDIQFLRDIQNNQCQGKCHQPSRRPKLITVTGNLIWDIAKLNLLIGFFIHFFEENNDKHTITRKQIDIVLGHHALHMQPTD